MELREAKQEHLQLAIADHDARINAEMAARAQKKEELMIIQETLKQDKKRLEKLDIFLGDE